MNKLFSLLATAAFALSIVAGGCAKEKPPAPPQPAKKVAVVSDVATGKKAPPKPRAKLFTGTIEDLDEAAGTVTLKGPKGERRFQAQKRAKGQLDGLEIGDKVIVKHDHEIVLSIVKPRTSKCALVLRENNEVL